MEWMNSLLAAVTPQGVVGRRWIPWAELLLKVFADVFDYPLRVPRMTQTIARIQPSCRALTG